MYWKYHMEKLGMANLKVNRVCAFCKHWYDPTNVIIRGTVKA